VPFRIQKAGPGPDASAIFVHFKPEDAEREIKQELPVILMNVRSAMPELIEAQFGDDFLRDIESVLIEAGDALTMGDAWEAYRRWREFMDLWVDRYGPILAEWWGELIVEDSATDKYYFYKEPPPKKPKLGLGGLKVWRVYTGDFVYPNKHPFTTMSEEAAKQKVGYWIRNWTVPAIDSQVMMWGTIGPRQENEHAEFVKDGRKLTKKIIADLDAGEVWKAYHRLKEFEEKFEDDFSPPFGLVGAIGSLRVEPEPPAE